VQEHSDYSGERDEQPERRRAHATDDSERERSDEQYAQEQREKLEEEAEFHQK
jgi:hypothetical protein